MVLNLGILEPPNFIPIEISNPNQINGPHIIGNDTRPIKNEFENYAS